MEEDEELFVHLSDDESGEIDDLPSSNVVDTQVQTDYYPYTYIYTGCLLEIVL